MRNDNLPPGVNANDIPGNERVSASPIEFCGNCGVRRSLFTQGSSCALQSPHDWREYHLEKPRRQEDDGSRDDARRVQPERRENLELRESVRDVRATMTRWNAPPRDFERFAQFIRALRAKNPNGVGRSDSEENESI